MSAVRGPITLVKGVAGIVLIVLLVALWPEGDRAPSNGTVVVVGGRAEPPAITGIAGPVAEAPSTPVDAAPTLQPVTTVSADELQHSLQSEPRDPIWAGRSESTLQAAIARTALRALPVAVRCASTLCEISGAIPANVSEAEQNAAMLALQSDETMAAIGATGLADIESGAIESDPSDPRRVLFRRYVARR